MSEKLDLTEIKNRVSALKMKIGRHFRAFRKALGKTQVQLARELEVHPSTIARIENGKIFPQVHYLRYLNKCCLMNSNGLFSDEGDTFSPGRNGYDGAAARPGEEPGNAPWYALDVAALGLPGRPGETRSFPGEVSRYHPLKGKCRDN